MLKIIPLGGLGEIGMNMMAFELDETIFVVDAGLMFPEDTMFGVDYVVPNITYLKENQEKVAGVILTHAHEDHIGALPYLIREINVPIFGTPFTLGMAKHKLTEFGMAYMARTHTISPGDTIRLGPFEIEFIRVAHSVVDGVGLCVDTPYGKIVHTGDFKLSHASSVPLRTDLNHFARLGAQGVLLLMSDSTNVEKKGYTLSDAEVGETLTQATVRASGRIIVALFASSITRIQQIIEISIAQNRKVAFHGRSIEKSTQIATQLGHLKIPEGLTIPIQAVKKYPPEDVVIITTGSQGEPMSALARMASGVHKQIEIMPDDTVILSSKFIPGNERAIGTIINNLYRRGAEVIYEKISAIHTSGHAYSEELKLMINVTRPKYFMPIHGEYRHLHLHAQLACTMGMDEKQILLVENGQEVVLDDTGVRTADKIETGRVMVDGKGIGDVGRSLLKERQMLSEEGVVAVTIAFDEETGVIMYGPEVVSRGFVFEAATGHLLDDAQCVILEEVESIAQDDPDRIEKVASRVKSSLRKYFFFAIGRRPLVLPFIIEV